MEIDRVVSAHSSRVDGVGADASDFRTGKKVWVSAGDIVLVGLREYKAVWKSKAPPRHRASVASMDRAVKF